MTKEGAPCTAQPLTANANPGAQAETVENRPALMAASVE
jgi:hypothetical protein